MMYLLGEAFISFSFCLDGQVVVQFHRISDGLGDFGMIKMSPWLHPVLDVLVEKVSSRSAFLGRFRPRLRLEGPLRVSEPVLRHRLRLG